MTRERPPRGRLRPLAACLALATLAAGSPGSSRPEVSRAVGARADFNARSGTKRAAEGVLTPAERQVLLPRIVIHKSERRLFYFEGGDVKHRFAVALGKRPIGAKLERGDWRTPEGEYFVTYRKPVSRYHRFLGLSYPNIRDAEEGLRRGLISAEELRRIREAIGARTQPSWTTQLGSGVGIHGEGVYRDEKRPEVSRAVGARADFNARSGTKRAEDGIDWTDGCIALSDEDAETLYALVPTGTPVAILP